MTKTFVAKPGDRWTKPPHMEHIYVYRDGVCTRVFPDGKVYHVNAHREPWETDLPTPDAHAQLREWGYEVTGDVAEVKPSSPTILPFGWYSQTISEANWAGPNFATPITESRVREIVAEVLAQRSQTGHYSHAMDDARVKEIVAGMLAEQVKPAPERWQDKCRVIQEVDGNQKPCGWGVFSPTRLYFFRGSSGGGWQHYAGKHVGYWFSNESAAREALSKAPLPPDVYEVGDGVPYGGKAYRIIETPKAPPPPDVDVKPQPDWKGLLERVCDAATIDEQVEALAAARKAVGK